MGLLTKAAQVIESFVETPDIAEPPSESERIALLEHELAISRRKCDEYFALIEGVLGERDDWKEMYYEMNRGAGVAQRMLQRQNDERSAWVAAALRELNALRAKFGVEPVTAPDRLMAPPLKSADEFEAWLAELEEKAPTETDGIAERDRIAASDQEGETKVS